MAVFRGDNVVLGYKKETTFNESPTNSTQTGWLGVIPNADFPEEPEYKDFRSVNKDRDLFLEAMGKINIDGSLPIEMQNARPIYFAMGTESVTGTGPYTHVVSGAGAGQELPSMCIEAVYQGSNNFLRYFSGVKINSVDLEASEGSEAKVTANLMIAQSTTLSATVSAVTATTSVPYMFHQGAVTIDTYAFDVTGFKWTVNNNLKRRWTIRSTAGKYAKMIIEGKRDYEIEAKVLIPDASTYNTKIYNMLMSGTTFTSTFSLTRTAGTDDMSLTASNCTVRSAPHNIPESGEEVEIAVRIKPRTCAWTTHDSIATY